MQTAWFVCWFRYEIFSDGQEAQLKRSAAWVVRPSPALFGKANSASGGGPAAEAPAAAVAKAGQKTAASPEMGLTWTAREKVRVPPKGGGLCGES